MKEYWFGMHINGEWKVGVHWEMLFSDKRVADSGEITEFDPLKRLVLKRRNEFKPELKAEGAARCVIELEAISDAVKLTITQSIDRPESKLIEAVSGGWPCVVSNLKSLLETGEVVLQEKIKAHTIAGNNTVVVVCRAPF